MACEALPVTWDQAAGRGLSIDTIRETFSRGLEASDVAIGRRIGDVDKALSGGVTIVRGSVSPRSMLTVLINSHGPRSDGRAATRLSVKANQLPRPAYTFTFVNRRDL
jgi:hypothetical protein